MASNRQLEQEIQRLRQTLVQAGIVPRETSARQHDYIEHGSDKHAAFMGLVEVTDVDEARELGLHVYRSPNSGRQWRLEDQITPFMHFPDPNQVAQLVLRQKVGELDAGRPPVPDDAPPMLHQTRR